MNYNDSVKAIADIYQGCYDQWRRDGFYLEPDFYDRANTRPSGWWYYNAPPGIVTMTLRKWMRYEAKKLKVPFIHATNFANYEYDRSKMLYDMKGVMYAFHVPRQKRLAPLSTWILLRAQPQNYVIKTTLRLPEEKLDLMREFIRAQPGLVRALKLNERELSNAA